MAGSTSETPVLDLLASMTTDSIEASSLDAETLALVRIAALVAVDAPAVSYLMNLAAAGELGVDAEQVRGVLAAVAPIVGTARVASATGNIANALDTIATGLLSAAESSVTRPKLMVRPSRTTRASASTSDEDTARMKCVVWSTVVMGR